jgi:electron transfer flavoprotein beta subunit
MEIIVCLKQVPSKAQVPIDPRTGALLRTGVPGDINLEDKHAIEEALLLREKHGGKVTAISMGPPQAEESLREALAMSVDEAVLLSDKAFAGADTAATTYVLGRAITKLGKFDLILCGKETSDGNTGQVGPQLAEYLQLPQVTYVRKVVITGKTLRAERALEDGYELVETKLPAVITVTRQTNIPRKPTIDTIIHACRQKVVIVWTAADLNIDRNRIGLNGSLTKMVKAFVPEPRKRAGKIVDGSTREVVGMLLQKLEQRHLI